MFFNLLVECFIPASAILSNTSSLSLNKEPVADGNFIFDAKALPTGKAFINICAASKAPNVLFKS